MTDTAIGEREWCPYHEEGTWIEDDHTEEVVSVLGAVALRLRLLDLACGHTIQV